MSLPAMTFGDRFCFSRQGGIGGGGLLHLKGTYRQHGCLWAPFWKCLGWFWVGHCCPP